MSDQPCPCGQQHDGSDEPVCPSTHDGLACILSEHRPPHTRRWHTNGTLNWLDIRGATMQVWL